MILLQTLNLDSAGFLGDFIPWALSHPLIPPTSSSSSFSLSKIQQQLAHPMHVAFSTKCPSSTKTFLTISSSKNHIIIFFPKIILEAWLLQIITTSKSILSHPHRNHHAVPPCSLFTNSPLHLRHDKVGWSPCLL